MQEKKEVFQKEQKNDEIFTILQESLESIFSIRKDKKDQRSYFSHLLVMMGDFHYKKIINSNSKGNRTYLKPTASILPQLQSGEVDMFSTQVATLMERRRSVKFFMASQKNCTKSTVVMDLYQAAQAIYPLQGVSKKINDLSRNFFTTSKNRIRFSSEVTELETKRVEIPKIVDEYIHSMVMTYQGELNEQLFEDLVDLIVYIAVNIEKNKILDNSDLRLAYSHLNELDLSIRNIYERQLQSAESQCASGLC